MTCVWFFQGQCCCAGSRTYVHERVYDEFIEKAKARAIKRVVGDPFKSGVEQGPQVFPLPLSLELNRLFQSINLITFTTDYRVCLQQCHLSSNTIIVLIRL